MKYVMQSFIVLFFPAKWHLLIISLSLFFAPLSANIFGEFIFENPPFTSCHASTLTETTSGHLLCAYFAGSEEGAKDVGIWLSTLTAKGWEAPRLIAAEQDVPCWNPVLFSLPSGEIILFYKVGPRPSSWSGVIKRSLDEGKTWSVAEPLPAGIIGPVKNKPLLLNDGSLLCGSSIESWHRWGCWIDITKDQGKTWHKSGPINLTNNVLGIIQPTLFFSSTNQLCLLARAYNTGFICSAFSKDEGITWTDASPIDLPNPNSAIDAISLRNGQIILVYNHSSKERTPLNIAISQDGAAHWTPALILENGPGEYSYPSIIQTKDDCIHITYTYNRTQIKHVVIKYSDLIIK